MAELGPTFKTRVMVVGLRVHQWLYEKTDGRIGHSIGRRGTFLLLRTTGRRTGKERVVALFYVKDAAADAERFVVVGSNGGKATHPGWYHNVTAQPEVVVQVGRTRIPARARTAEGEERERLWKQADEANGSYYSGYATRTDRPIPVVVLEPVGPAAN